MADEGGKLGTVMLYVFAVMVVVAGLGLWHEQDEKEFNERLTEAVRQYLQREERTR